MPVSVAAMDVSSVPRLPIEPLGENSKFRTKLVHADVGAAHAALAREGGAAVQHAVIVDGYSVRSTSSQWCKCELEEERKTGKE